MRMLRSISGAVVLVLAIAHRAHAGFSAGALIIPTNASYQDDCGAVSAYGLVYNVLRAEGWLVANGKPRITINYVVSPSKTSPNRCRPSNQFAGPTGSALWDDGCDFQLSNGAGNIVKLVNNSSTSAASDALVNTVDTTSNPAVYPQYTSKPLDATATTVGYLGGAFIIDGGVDATNFLALLDGTYAATDADVPPNPIDFGPYRATGTCIFGVSHHVNVHRAQFPFSAPVRKSFTAQPPRLAVLETDSTGSTGPIKVITPVTVPLQTTVGGATEAGFTATYTTQYAHGFVPGNRVTISGVKKPEYNGVFTIQTTPTLTTFTVTLPVSGLPASRKGKVDRGDSILEDYLANGGIDFDGAQGCPTGGQNIADPVLCPNGGSAGQIFDIFDFADLANNKLQILDSGVKRYTMLWTPHWETTAGPGSPPSATELVALSNISAFLDGQTGLMGECASISTFEGAYLGGAPNIVDGTAGANLQLQTCVNSAGSCAAVGTQWGIDRNPAAEPIGTFHNCSDPASGGFPGSDCVAFGTPTDEFVQLGDYLWNTGSSLDHVRGYTPLGATGSMFKPGVIPLVAEMSGGSLISYSASRSIKDNTPGKANVLYLGGHDQSNSVAGTKLALETLLLLGESTVPVPTTTTETSRSTPIVATVAAGVSALVVGTFENVQPPQLAPVVAATADLTGWTFPFVKGHLRATDLTSITGAIAQGAGTVLFDAATQIPAVSNSCGTIDGSCRVVFTTTVTPSTTTGVALRPPNVYVTDANAPTIGALLAVGTTLVPADYVTITRRLLAGWWTGATYVAALGGIDRSTVAVIGPSTLTIGARATMAYVGATDGMLHAFCAQVDVAHGCPHLGTELWAFLPRVQLASVRSNLSVIDGSPRVIDAFGDFTGSGTKSFRTILMFQTGSGDPNNLLAAQPAIYALDITDPQNPAVIWERSIKVPGPGRGLTEMGVGLALAAGPINVGGVTRNLVVAQTTNGGTLGVVDATAGEVVNGIDMTDGSLIWATPFTFSYAPTRAGGTSPPHSGVPGGAVGVDKQGQGFLTDIVFGDLYGDVWELDAVTGVSRFPTNKPLFSFTTDFHPIGSPPAIYANSGKQFAVISTGGYLDVTPLIPVPSWGTGHQQSVVAIALDPAPLPVPPLNESSPVADIPFKFDFATTAEAGFSQAQIVGGELFVTTDSTDVNASGYGTAGSTGHVYRAPLSSVTTVVAVQGGAAALAAGGTALFAASSSQQERLGTDAASTVGNKVDSQGAPRISRMLWLRTE